MDKLNKRKGAKLNIFAFSYSLHKCLPIVFESFDCLPPKKKSSQKACQNCLGQAGIATVQQS